MRPLRLAPLALLLVVPALAHAAGTVEVSATGFAFDPDPVEIPVGDSVHWTNEDGVNHSVHFNGEDAPLKEPSPAADMGSRTFAAAGTFKYRCDVHPSMTGTIVVGDGGGTPTATPTATATATTTATATPEPTVIAGETPTPAPSGRSASSRRARASRSSYGPEAGAPGAPRPLRSVPCSPSRSSCPAAHARACGRPAR
jgi:plastocyanin